MKKVETGKTILNKILNGFGRVLSLSALLLITYCLRPMPLSAEVPVKFTYQGNLRQSGFLVNGNRNMVFRIYDSSANGTELCPSLVHSNVSISTGVFRVTLEPVIADWQSGNLWLELEVEGNRMAPREELTSSPYAINSLMLSGKRYTSAASSPTAVAAGDLWYDSSLQTVNYWNGAAWVGTSGAGLPGAHAATHSGAGSDPIVSLGTHTVTGYITVSSAVTAGWFNGDGFGIYNLDASKISLGSLNGDRIGNVIVSTHIVDGSIQTQDLADGSVTKAKINQSGCSDGQILKWNNTLTRWDCAADNAVAGMEIDPLSIHNQETLQAGTTFYVSSGTVNDLNINNSLKVNGTALLRGALGQQGLSVEASGNVGIGMAGAAARLEVKGVDTQSYSLVISTGAAPQMVISTSGAVGIGTGTPRAKMEVTGSEDSGKYIMIFNSGSKAAAWLRNK